MAISATGDPIPIHFMFGSGVGFQGRRIEWRYFRLHQIQVGGRPPSGVFSNGDRPTAHSIHLYSAHRAAIFAIAQLSCLKKRSIIRAKQASIKTLFSNNGQLFCRCDRPIQPPGLLLSQIRPITKRRISPVKCILTCYLLLVDVGLRSFTSFECPTRCRHRDAF